MGTASQIGLILLVAVVLPATHSRAFAVENAELISAASDKAALDQLVVQEDRTDPAAATQALLEAVRSVTKSSDWALLNLTKALAGRAVEKHAVALAVARRSYPGLAPERVVDALVAMLRDNSWGTRGAGAIVLGLLGTDAADAMDALVNRHEIETDSDVKRELAAAAVRIDPARGFTLSVSESDLQQLIQERDRTDPAAATQALFRAVRLVESGNLALLYLTKELARRVADKREVAAAVASRSSSDVTADQAVNRLVAMLSNAESLGTRASAAIALGLLGTEAADAIDALLRQYGVESDADARRELGAAAIRIDPERGFGLGLISAADVSDSGGLQQLIQERDPAAATQALFEAVRLVHKSSEWALFNLTKALAGRLADKREVAAAVASRSGSDIAADQVVHRLVAMLSDADSWGTRGSAAIALGLLGTEAADAIDALLGQYAVESDAEVRGELLAAVVRMDPDRGFALSLVSAADVEPDFGLQQLIQERDRSEPAAATEALFEAVRLVDTSYSWALFNLTKALAGRVVDKLEVAAAVASRSGSDVAADQVVDRLVATLDDADSWGTRGSAAIALGLLASDTLTCSP